MKNITYQELEFILPQSNYCINRINNFFNYNVYWIFHFKFTYDYSVYYDIIIGNLGEIVYIDSNNSEVFNIAISSKKNNIYTITYEQFINDFCRSTDIVSFSLICNLVDQLIHG